MKFRQTLIALLGVATLLLSFQAHAQDPLARYLLLLKEPQKSGSKKDGPNERARGELAQMLQAYAPRIWWHSQDPYPPMDPLEFLTKSALYYRSSSGREKRILAAGQIDPARLREIAGANPKVRPYQNGFALNGSGYFLRYEDPKQGARALASSKKVPLLWRLGEGSFARLLAREGARADRRRVLIEYWYHVPYNLATRIGIGNHQGDWEGVSMLIELSIQEGHLSHRLLASFFAEHESGTWLCSRELSRTSDGAHIEAFSAMGTHATYHQPGNHWSAVLIDETEKGIAWDSWNDLRPLALEPYYGFSGAWGESRMFSFMTGPLVPGPGYKSLPQDQSEKEETATLTSLMGRCVKAMRK